MSHLLLTSILLFALLGIVAIAIGGCLGIARDLLLDAQGDCVEAELTPVTDGTREGGQSGLANDFGLGLRHAATFAQDNGRPFRRSGSFDARV